MTTRFRIDDGYQQWSASDDGDQDDTGVVWFLQSESGWEDGAPLNSPITGRARGDGGDAGSRWSQARPVTISGQAYIDQCTASGLAAAKRRLTVLLKRGDRIGLLTGEDDIALSATVVLGDGSPVKIGRGPDPSKLFTWQLQLVAPDPLRYGPRVDVPIDQYVTRGELAFPVRFPLAPGTTKTTPPFVPNDGDVDTYPIIVVPGPITNPTISSDTGDSLTLRTTLRSGESITIDCREQMVWLNGTTARSGLVEVTGRWLPIPPGGTSLRFLSALLTTAQLTVTTFPAYE